jgi:hypothetical protein
MAQPVRIRRVRDWYSLPAGQGCKFSVAQVERCKFGGRRKILLFPRLVFRKVRSLNAPGRAVEDFQVETIADARLPARAQIAVVFRLDFSGQIQDHATARKHFLKEFDRCQPTHWRWMLPEVFQVRTAIGDDWHVGIDGNAAYFAAATRRRRAFSASAASPKASPMKLVGQFSIFPKRSNCSRSKVDPRSVMSQK